MKAIEGFFVFPPTDPMPEAAAANLDRQDATSEYVVGGRRSPYDRSAVRLDGRDSEESRLTARALRRLRLDAEIEADVSMLADSVFADGVEIVAAVRDEEDPEFALAAEIAEFNTKALAAARRPFVAVAKEMFKAAFYNGVKVGEIVLRLEDENRGGDPAVGGRLVLDRINPKPLDATAFVTDKFLNVIGLVGARYPGASVVTGGTLNISADEIIPREKFLVVSFELEDNDPRGLSQVRAAFEAYCDKQLTRAQWKEFRRTSAIPKKFATTHEDAKPVPVKNADGTPKIVDGVQETISAERALMNALENFANDSSIAGPYGTKVTQLEVEGEGEVFANHFRVCNSEIRKVILGDSLVTGEADKDARAARESSKDVMDIRKQALRALFADAVERDVLRLLTIVNFGADKAHLTPRCFLGDTEANDWQGDLQAAAKAGYTFAPEHFGQLDAQFGLEPRTEAPEQPVGGDSDSEDAATTEEKE